MTPDKKNRLSYDIMFILLGLCLLTFITRLWPILLLMLLGLFGSGLWLLGRVQKQATIIVPPPSLPPTPQQPISEQEIITVAFGLVQRRITERVTAVYPNARWVWSEPGARERFAASQPLTILLNGAGGYQKALVQVSDLQFYGLHYLPQDWSPASDEEDQDPPEEEPPESEPIDYGLLAFEWVEANLQRLNAQGSDALANSQTEFHIPAEELPHGDSWPTICWELVRNGFAGAEAVADGIWVEIKSDEKENDGL